MATFSHIQSVRVTNKPQSVSNAAYNFPGRYSASGITN